MSDKYPYQTFYSRCEPVFKRDNYTCQVCGEYKAKVVIAVETGCLVCEKKGLQFQPISERAIPTPCKEQGLTFQTCGQCPQFKKDSVERIIFPSLLAHHLDGNKLNQKLDNLVTVCTSCHRRLHPRGKIKSIEEAKKDIQKKKHKIIKK